MQLANVESVSLSYSNINTSYMYNNILCVSHFCYQCQSLQRYENKLKLKYNSYYIDNIKDVLQRILRCFQ